MNNIAVIVIIAVIKVVGRKGEVKMLQKFLDGKKKYSAFIITVLATVIPLFIQEPEAQKTFLDMVPSLAAALAGIFYIVTQGRIDKEKEKTTAEFYKAQASANGSAMGNVAPNGVQAQPAQSQPEIPPTPAPPFNIKAFHEQAIKDTPGKYGEVNPATLYYEARDKGQVTECFNIQQALNYWGYLADLAYEARDYIEAEAIKEAPPGSCKPRNSELYIIRRDVSTTLRMKDNLEALAKAGVNWPASLPSHQRTLYTLGALAESLLKNR